MVHSRSEIQPGRQCELLDSISGWESFLVALSSTLGALGSVLIVLTFSRKVAYVCHGSSFISLLPASVILGIQQPLHFALSLSFSVQAGSVYYETVFSETLWVFHGFQWGLLH